MSNGTRTVMVTGAAGGIGRATAERLHGNGWNVLAVDRDGGKLAWTTASGIASSVADIASEDENLRIVEEAERKFGRLDAAVFNAGITGGGGIEAITMEYFRRVIEVNLCGTVAGIRAVLPALRRQGGGAIAVTSSTMGIAGDAENSAYCASKHALIGMVHSLSRELGWQNIRINALCPGLTADTGMTAPVRAFGEAAFQGMARAVPLQRWASADEMASVLEFLISPASSYVNGHAIVADGGAVVGTGLVQPADGKKPAMHDVSNH